MGNALMGVMADIMHDVWMCSMDNAWMGAMTDKLYSVWMDGDLP